MSAHIDPATGELVGFDPEVMLTAAQVLNTRVTCPRCGARVTVPTRDMGGKETVGDRHFTYGRHTFNCRCYSPPVD